MTSSRRQRQSGVVLLAVLIFILVMTMASGSLVVVVHTQLQREKEDQLIFAGTQLRRAIASYFNTIPPGGARALPQTLEVLLNDDRFPRPIQHLRRIYADPMTGKLDWELIREGGGVVGVRSTSIREPIKKRGFPKGLEHLEDKQTYADWTFAVR